MKTLYNKSFLKFSDFTSQEILYLLNFSKILKKKKQKNKEIKYLKNKKIILIFEQTSTRTRCAFEIAAYEQGAYTTILNPSDTHIKHKESIEDSIKIFNLLYDGIQYRGNSHNTIKLFKKYAKIPVWNGLTQKFHPTQVLADIFTMKEIYPNLSFFEIKCAYIGDAQNNISNTLLEAAKILKFQLTIIAPKKYWPKKEFLEKYIYNTTSKINNIQYTENISIGTKKIHFIYTDVWVSMTENENCWTKKIKDLLPYQVNENLIYHTKNPNIKILHCLPALHNQDSILGKKLHTLYNLKNGLEITHSIFKSKYNISFQQANNKLHTIKALLISNLCIFDSFKKIFK
ncbi:ornithine carbamoyltransferase [Buchnera aphidicola]|uniref:Ornithine carbamoyltransferase n=1 Tax=Buchnera aphidicola subsp. Tuberolachnus salignus TaxID=98804 RepID=A0A160SX26_BUCTT|nr:ornithine carbamoyltransferase [Buchnera aphidicola]CUR53218.1 Ornithine carbamoyltransferase chain I [Buchnera aphidicola (Tuberolachnus salignus)]